MSVQAFNKQRCECLLKYAIGFEGDGQSNTINWMPIYVKDQGKEIDREINVSYIFEYQM